MIGRKLVTQTKIQKLYETNTPKLPTQDTNDEVLVFPFRINGGFVVSTEAGQQPFGTNERDFTTYKRVFTGKESIIAQWDQSTTAIQQDDGSYNATYEVGRTEHCLFSNENVGTTWQQNPNDETFQEQIIQKDVIVTTSKWDPKALQFSDPEKMLFIIPELRADQWLYMSNVDLVFDKDKEFSYATITFSSLNDKVARSGRAIEQFIQISAIGEGGAYPKIVFNDEPNPNNPTEIKSVKEVILDPIRLEYKPVDNIQIEFFGFGGISNISAMGRPIGLRNDVNKIEAPRRIVASDMLTPISTDINRASLPTSNFVWANNIQPQIVEQFNSWQEKIKSEYQLNKEATYYGTIKTNTQADILETNQIISGGYSHSIWDDNFLIKTNILNYDTQAEYETADYLSYRPVMTPAEIFAHNTFAHSHIKTLPMSLKETQSWNATNIPLIGKYLNTERFGLPFGWKNSNIWIKTQPVNLFLPAENYRHLSTLQLGTGGNNDVLPFDAFLGENSLNAILGSKAQNMTFRIALTDQMSLPTIVGDDTEKVPYKFDENDTPLLKPIENTGTSGGKYEYNVVLTYNDDTLTTYETLTYTPDALTIPSSSAGGEDNVYNEKSEFYNSTIKGWAFNLRKDFAVGQFLSYGRLESLSGSNTLTFPYTVELRNDAYVPKTIADIKSISIKRTNLITGVTEELVDYQDQEVRKDGTETNKTYSTLYLGQTKYEDGTDILPDGKPLVWNKSSKPVGKGAIQGYALDLVRWQGIFNGVYKITAFQGETQVWTSAYLSSGAFTGNPREWTNYVKTSNWDNVNMIGQQVRYPDNVAEPATPQFDNQKVINIDKNVNISDFIELYNDNGDTDPKTTIIDINKNDLTDLSQSIDVGSLKTFYDSVTITYSLEDTYNVKIFDDRTWPISNENWNRSDVVTSGTQTYTISVDDLIKPSETFTLNLPDGQLAVERNKTASGGFVGKQTGSYEIQNTIEIKSTDNLTKPLEIIVLSKGDIKQTPNIDSSGGNDSFMKSTFISNVNIISIVLNPKLST